MQPNQTQFYQRNLLIACRENDLEGIATITEKLSEEQLETALNLTDSFGNTALFYACMHNNYDAVDNFFENGATLNSILNSGVQPPFKLNNEGRSILEILCINGYVDILDNLIQKIGADENGLQNFINIPTNGKILITHACENQQSEIVESLVRNFDIDLNAKDAFDRKPLDYSRSDPKMLILKKFFSLLPQDSLDAQQNSNRNFSSFLYKNRPQNDELKIFLHEQYHDSPNTNRLEKIRFSRLVLDELNKTSEFEPSLALDVVCEFYKNPEILKKFSNFLQTSKSIKEKIMSLSGDGQALPNQADLSEIEKKLSFELIGIIVGKILSSQKINVYQCSKLTSACAASINALKNQPVPQNTATNPNTATPLNPQQAQGQGV